MSRTAVMGDIGGVCFPRAGLMPTQLRTFNGLTARWTGMRRVHLESCAARAAGEGPDGAAPGVVVISTGEERASFVFHAVKLGLINHLIIDHGLGRS